MTMQFTITESPALKGLAHEIRDELLLAAAEKWDRYDNPFEQKYVLRKEAYTIHIEALLNHLRSFVIDLPPDIVCDYTDHYTAIFKYVVGDYLDLHMDAAISPINGKRKAWTLLYYLSTQDVRGGMLEFWTGENLVETIVGEFVEPKFGTIALFRNKENEFHGNPTPVESGVRMVATVSFMSNSLEDVPKRERAYFIPRPGYRPWDERKYELRDARASTDKFEEVYRVGA